MTETIISPNVFEYDHRLFKWNNLVYSFETQTQFNTMTLQNIVQWWNNYPMNQRKTKIYSFNNKPGTVWDILEKYKISKLDKVYGIYYTIECIASYYDINATISFCEIQKIDGEYDLAIVINDFVIYDNEVFSTPQQTQCSFLNDSLNYDQHKYHYADVG